MSPDFSSLTWRKALRSVNNGECVELAKAGSMVAVRDSKDPAGPVLMYSEAAWRVFLDDARRGEFDRC